MPDKLVLRVALGDPLALATFLKKRLPDVPTQALIKSGGVHVNGARERDPKRALTVGARVLVYTQGRRGDRHAVTVHLQDSDLAVVEKPAGMLAQAVAAESEGALDLQLKRQLGPHAVAMHRLDRDTSGLVLVALTEAARAALAADLAAHRVQRDYVAIVKQLDQIPPRIALRIARDPDDPRRRRALPEADLAGEAAVTTIRPLASSATRAAVLLSLETGRTHQLRVHLAAVGQPIVGDTIYDGEPAPRLLLHAARLRFVHPTSGAPVVVRAPVPLPLREGLPDWDPDLIFAEDGSD